MRSSKKSIVIARANRNGCARHFVGFGLAGLALYLGGLAGEKLAEVEYGIGGVFAKLGGIEPGQAAAWNVTLMLYAVLVIRTPAGDALDALLGLVWKCFAAMGKNLKSCGKFISNNTLGRCTDRFLFDEDDEYSTQMSVFNQPLQLGAMARFNFKDGDITWRKKWLSRVDFSAEMLTLLFATTITGMAPALVPLVYANVTGEVDTDECKGVTLSVQVLVSALGVGMYKIANALPSEKTSPIPLKEDAPFTARAPSDDDDQENGYQTRY